MTPRATLLWVAGTVGAGLTVWAGWVQLGGAIPASQDHVLKEGTKIRRAMTRGFMKVESVNKKQTAESAKWGRKIYNKELHDLLLIPPLSDPVQKRYLQEAIEDATRQRKYYNDLEIELRKK